VKTGNRQAAAAEGERDAAATSAKAAERSAAAAEQALRSTREESRARLAYVLGNVSTLASGQRPVADLFLQNKGRATATKILQRIWIRLLDADVKQLPHPSSAETVEAESLGPDDHIVTGIVFPRPLTQQEVDEIRAGKKAYLSMAKLNTGTIAENNGGSGGVPIT
jgi:hypothetical protein